jgi:hypothetical protein
MWAYLSFHTFKGLELWGCPVHAFIKYKEKFYDSETLRGTDDYRKLPCIASIRPARLSNPMIDHRSIGRRLSLTQFKKEWAAQTDRFSTTWEDLYSQARKVLVQANGYH